MTKTRRSEFSFSRVVAFGVLAGATALGACGLNQGASGISDERRKELRATADKATRLSELQRQAYTRNTLLQFSAAEQDYRETLGLARDLFPTDPARASSLRLHLALNKSNLGQFESAESLFDRSRRIVEELGPFSERAKPDLFYAQHQMNLKQFDKAEEIASGAVAKLDRLIATVKDDGGGTNLDRMELVRRSDGAILVDQTQANIANARTARDASFDENAVRLSETQRLRLQRVQALYVKARALRALGANADTIDELIAGADKDLVGIPDVFGRWLRAEISSLRADRLAKEGKTDASVAQLDKAIGLLRKFEMDSRPEALLLFKKGEILIEGGQGRLGQASYRKALDIIRNDSQGLEVEQARSVIDRLLDDAQGGDTEAQDQLFLLMQKVRSSATAQTVAQLSARLSSGDSARARAIREVQDLERKINVLSARFDRLEADPNADFHYKRVTESKLAELKNKFDDQQKLLEEIAPNYDQLVDTTLTLKEAQEALADGEVMAIIQLGVDKGLVAVVTNLSFDAFETTLNLQAAEEEVRELRKPIDGEFLLAFDLERSYDLFKTLFGPVKSKIKSAEHLIIVPTGPLMSMPFNVLLTDEYKDEIKIEGTTPETAYFDYSKVKWLGSQSGITTGVSISSFFIGRRVPASGATKPFRGFGDFKQFGEDDLTVTKIAQQRGLPESCKVSVKALGLLNELPGTKTELEKVQEALGVSDQDVILGNDFNDIDVKKMKLNDFRVLHFATHGLLAQDPQCLPEPGLVTSLGKDGDSLLEASEIVDLDLDAELVVMSACDTGAGAGQAATDILGFRGAGGSYAAGGESLNGLARSFFFAGARNVVSTHWSVDDRATQELMVGFYDAVAKDNDISIAEAMRQSQEKQIDNGELSHPFFWAPFATIGDGARQLRLGVDGGPADADKNETDQSVPEEETDESASVEPSKDGA